MPDLFKSVKITQPTPGGPLVEQVVGAVQTSTGTAADAGKLVVLNATGQIDSSMISGGSSSVSVNGTSVSNPNFNGTTPAAPAGHTNVVWQSDLSGNVSAYYITSGTTTPFNAVTSGDNTTATMTVDTGASLSFTGSGVVNANEINAINVSGNSPTHAGQLLISQPGNTTALWADPQVQGLYDAGSTISPAPAYAAPTNIQPVLIGGSDGSVLRNVLTDSSGHLIVASTGTTTVSGTVAVSSVSGTVTVAGTVAVSSVAGTVTISGTVAATQSGTWTVQQGSPPWTTDIQASGTALTATGSSLNVNITGGSSSNTQYTGSPVVSSSAIVTTAASGYDGTNVRPILTSSTGQLHVIIDSGGTGGFTQYTDGTTQATPTGTVAMGKNSSNVLHSLALDGNGNLNVDTQAAVFAAANNTAVPASAAWIGASDGTNLQGLQVESSTNKNLKVAIYQGGNEVTVTGANALKVDGSAVTQPVSIAGTVLVSNTTQNYAQGSTTSGQIGPLVQAAVSTSDPTYTNAQTNPLSLTTTGHLRTQDSAEANANGSTSVPTNAMYVGGKGADGFLHPLSTDNSGILNVNASFSGTVTPGFVTDRVQSGAITSTQTVVISTYGAASVIFNITGTWTGTISFQSQLADNSWVTATAYPVFIGGAGVTSTSSNGEWQIPVGGMQAFRVIGNTVSSGTATANLEAGAGAYSLFVQQLSASDLNATVVQGNAGTIGQSWFVKVTDGSNVYGTGSSFPFSVQGTKTNNNAAPGANNIGVLPALANAAAPSYTDGDQVLLSVDTTGALRVSSSGTFTPALTADITATGTITSTQSVTLSTQGTGTTLFNITGSWTGTIVFEASVDGVNFVPAKAVGKYPLTVPGVSQATANGQWAIPTGGLSKFRLRGNNVTSGTATIWLEGGAGAQDMAVFAVITDPNSTNTPAVKAASTVPLATDQSLVVSLSPNSAQFATSTTANALPGVNPVSVGTSSVAILNSNASRKEAIVINTGVTIIYLGLGQTPTTTAYHIALAPCSTANDGTGGTWTSDMWKGTINAIGSAVSGTVNVTELT
jgi:hypothetical protein